MEGFDQEGFNKNIDLLKQIAAKSQAAVGKWDTPLPGQKGKVRVDRNGTRLTKEVIERRRAKRMGLRGFGFQKVNGKWVKTEVKTSTPPGSPPEGKKWQ